MIKTFLKEATVLSVYDFHQDEKIFLGKTLFGIVSSDQTYRFPAGQRIITSLIESQNNFEFITRSENCYVVDDQPDHFELRLSEFVVMRHLLLSPAEVIEAREILEREDAKRLH
tara:strand:+ start:282 stop:623 length:342 start_codon:yes stop_codon:yes gene_type:complete